MRSVIAIIEGHGEEESVPILLRRMLDPTEFSIEHPIRVKRDQFLKLEEEFNRVVALALAKAGSHGIILIILDADDDCPAMLGPRVLSAVNSKIMPNQSAFCIIAKREFEAWFLASAESLRGKRGIPVDLLSPKDPEGIRGAKEWLSEKMKRKYRPVLDQPAFTAIFDLPLAQSKSLSFDKLLRDISSLH